MNEFSKEREKETTMSLATFDLDDLADLAPETPLKLPDNASEVEEWAEKVASGERQGNPEAAFWDIETGPRPMEEIECFYLAPEPLPPWDDSMVKYGNAKREELRTEKREAHQRTYQKQLDNQTATLAADKAEWLEKAALSPITGRVLLIGVLVPAGQPLFLYDNNEAFLLDQFWRYLDIPISEKCPIIGHNSNGFDLPFVVRRSWQLGVDVPREVRQGRYWNPLFRDTMEQWNCGTKGYIKLNTLGLFFGVGQKTEGVEGKDYFKLWFGEMPSEQWGTPEEQRVKAIEYNGQDLKLTAAIAAKMGMV